MTRTQHIGTFVGAAILILGMVASWGVEDVHASPSPTECWAIVDAAHTEEALGLVFDKGHGEALRLEDGSWCIK